VRKIKFEKNNLCLSWLNAAVYLSDPLDGQRLRSDARVPTGALSTVNLQVTRD
jgi:hypothetical protein